MATFLHPVTGVKLNVIEIRKSKPRGKAERETVMLLLKAGETEHIVAAMFGTNQGRINDIIKEEEGKGGGKAKKSSTQPALF